jgi:hypothetical protein
MNLKTLAMITLSTMVSGFGLPAMALPKALPHTFTQAAGSMGSSSLSMVDLFIVSVILLAGAIALWAAAASGKKTQKRRS